MSDDEQPADSQDTASLVNGLEKQIAQHEIAVKYLSRQRDIVKELEQEVAGLEKNIKARTDQVQSLKVPLPTQLRSIPKA